MDIWVNNRSKEAKYWSSEDHLLSENDLCEPLFWGRRSFLGVRFLGHFRRSFVGCAQYEWLHNGIKGLNMPSKTRTYGHRPCSFYNSCLLGCPSSLLRDSLMWCLPQTERDGCFLVLLVFGTIFALAVCFDAMLTLLLLLKLLETVLWRSCWRGSESTFCREGVNSNSLPNEAASWL